MNDATKLKVPDSLTVAMDTESYIGKIEHYLIDNDLVDLSGDYTKDVVLDDPSIGAVHLGTLNLFEKKAFSIAHLIDSIINDMVIDAQATQTEQAALLMREEKIHAPAAALKVAERGIDGLLTETDRIYMNTLMVTSRTLASAFEWSVRTRYDQFGIHVVVCTGFEVYAVADPTIPNG